MTHRSANFFNTGKYFHCTLLFILTLFIPACNSNNPAEGEKKEERPAKDSISRSNKTFFSDCRQLLREARRMDSILLQQTEMDRNSANMAIRAFVDFANYCHQDTLSPVYLIKCAQVARAVNNVPQAKVVLDKCIQDYPNFKDRPAALFLLAQLYDEVAYLNNESEARKIYEEIIADYPKSDWALSARGAIQFLGKSDEEIMKELKRKK